MKYYTSFNKNLTSAINAMKNNQLRNSNIFYND